MKSVFVWLVSPAYCLVEQGPTGQSGISAQPQVPRLAQAASCISRAAEGRKCTIEGKTPHTHPCCPHSTHKPRCRPSYLNLFMTLAPGQRKSVSRKNKRYLFDLRKGLVPGHLKGLSGHHTSCIQGHFTGDTPTPTLTSPDARYLRDSATKNLKSPLGSSPSFPNFMEATTETV